MINPNTRGNTTVPWSSNDVPVISDAQNKALAGVGKPINEVVCRSSKLNLANLSAENAAMTKAK